MRLFLVGMATAISACPVWAQLPAARLSSVFPPGGKAGSTVEVSIAGTDLDEAGKLSFSHPGITAVQKTNPPGPADKAPVPVVNQFVVTVAGNTPIGLHEVRAVGKFGISNPRAFVVGAADEAAEKEPNNAINQPTEIKVGSTTNGVIGGAADLDFYKFTATKGQRIIIDCWAQRIDSRLDATLALLDEKGKELAASRDVNRRDPLIDFTAPADGSYLLKLFDFVYAGGNDYFYRVHIGTAPYIDFVLPSAGVPGTSGKFVVYGRNLPGGTPASGVSVEGKPLEMLSVEIPVPSGANQQELAMTSLVEPEGVSMDGFEYRLTGPGGPSNPVLLGFAQSPPTAEHEPNNNPSTAQRITAPGEFVGQFYPRGDQDWFTFEAKKGDVYWIEVVSQRQGVSTDPQLIVQRVTVNDKGVETVNDLQEADDLATNIGGTSFDTRADDPVYRFAAPDNGTYRIMLCDLYRRGDPRYVYRLVIRPERPDFRLAAVPVFPNTQNNQTGQWTTFLRRGGTASLNILAYRLDGFPGEIEITASGLPSGVTCPPAIIGAGMNSTVLVLTASEDAAEWSGTIQVSGKARIGDADVVRQARGGQVIWPGVQNNPAESRMTRDIALAVGAETAPFLVDMGENKVWEMSRAGKLEIPVKAVRRGDFKGNLTLAPVNLPQNVRVANLTINANAADGKLVVEIPNNAPLGTYTFNLLATTQVSYRRNVEAATAADNAKKEVDKLVTELTEAGKKVTKEQADAAKAATDSAAEAKKAADAKTAADKAAADADAAAKAAAEKAKTAADAAGKDTGNQGLADAKVAAEKAAAEAAEKAKAANEAKAAAEKAANEAAAKAKTAADAKAAADKAATDAAAKLKAATDAQAAAAKKATDTANASKANNVNVFEPSTAVTVRIVAAPITVQQVAAAMVKQGDKVEVSVKVDRLFGYADPIDLEVALPQGVSGLKVAKVTIPKDQSEGKLVIEADAKATAGNHMLNLKGTARFNGQALTADQTVALTVEAVAAEKK